jgi:glutamate racemase
MRIGVFDSGVGGITVLTELRKKFGSVDFVYLGDTAHVPYGSKSPAQIEKLSRDCAELLKKRAVDALVVACNTASSWAFEAIQDVMNPIPVFGVVQPGVEALAGAYQNLVEEGRAAPTLLVLATRATVQSHAYGNHIRAHLEKNFPTSSQPIPVLEQACPLLVPMIEEGWINHPILHQTIWEYVAPYVKDAKPGIHSAFEKAMPGWKVVNSAQAVASSLEGSSLFKGAQAAHADTPSGKIEWIFTDPNAVPAFARNWVQ